MGFLQTANTLALIARGRLPGQLVIQLTDRCNGRCPQCEMRATNRFSRAALPIDQVKRILDAAARRGVTAVSFTGGEPLLLLDDLAHLLDHAGALHIPFLRTGTNGFFLCEPDTPGWDLRVRHTAETLAGTPLRNLWISLDSADPATHDAMRGFHGLMKGIEKAIPLFNESGLFPSANLGINRNLGGKETARLTWDPPAGNGQAARFYDGYRRAFARFFQRAIDLGFTIANVCYPMSLDTNASSQGLDPPYAATSGDQIVRFRPEEKTVIFKALLDTITEVRRRIRIFVPRTSLHVLIQEHQSGSPAGHPCRGGLDFFFIDAQKGYTYPCGYRGAESLGPFPEMNGHAAPSQACRKCDWECFRDPSELLGPLLDLTSNPLRIAHRLIREPAYRRLWLNDLHYYHACDYFHGRRPFDFHQLRRF